MQKLFDLWKQRIPCPPPPRPNDFVRNTPGVGFWTPMLFPLQPTLRMVWPGRGCLTSPGERECWCLPLTGKLFVLTYHHL